MFRFTITLLVAWTFLLIHLISANTAGADSGEAVSELAPEN